jgi:hypothetical protein
MENKHNLGKTMYHQRLARPEDAIAIAPLWRDFAQRRSEADPSINLKPDFDYEGYVGYQLKKPLSFGFVLEYEQQIVGFLFTYVYDETPPPQISALEMWENPFIPRRVGAVLGMYVKEKHRKPDTINLLIKAAIAKAEELKVSDIDLLISIDQQGIQVLLERLGFVKAAIQYTKHFNISDKNLPNLHQAHLRLREKEVIPTGTIVLRDIKTQEIVKNSQGKPIFLEPVRDAAGKALTSSTGLPIYPLPLRDPNTHNLVFDEEENLILCPILQELGGEVVEFGGIPQFCPPVYEQVDGKLCLKQDSNGNYVFAEVERDESGKIRRLPEGKPLFKSTN